MSSSPCSGKSVCDAFCPPIRAAAAAMRRVTCTGDSSQTVDAARPCHFHLRRRRERRRRRARRPRGGAPRLGRPERRARLRRAPEQRRPRARGVGGLRRVLANRPARVARAHAPGPGRRGRGAPRGLPRRRPRLRRRRRRERRGRRGRGARRPALRRARRRRRGRRRGLPRRELRRRERQFFPGRRGRRSGPAFVVERLWKRRAS